jgi:hypothetical protein
LSAWSPTRSRAVSRVSPRHRRILGLAPLRADVVTSRMLFSKTMVVCYRMHFESSHLALGTIDVAAVTRIHRFLR